MHAWKLDICIHANNIIHIFACAVCVFVSIFTNSRVAKWQLRKANNSKASGMENCNASITRFFRSHFLVPFFLNPEMFQLRKYFINVHMNDAVFWDRKFTNNQKNENKHLKKWAWTVNSMLCLRMMCGQYYRGGVALSPIPDQRHTFKTYISATNEYNYHILVWRWRRVFIKNCALQPIPCM